MPERDGYIPGVPCWVDTSQPDPDAATDFYGGLFGWEFEDVMPEGSDAKYFMARSEGSAWSMFDTSGEPRSGIVAAVGSIPEGMPQIATWNTYIWVDSADETASRVRDAGGSVVMEPFDVMDSGRMAVFTDPEGAAFGVWQAKEFKGAELVNDPGTLNFNGLNTRDVEGARKFYPSVFGWETLDLGGGMAFWTLPGYGDHLESFQPGLREQVTKMGGPVGFEDVVAALNPIPDDQPDTPPHWSVTFATDDADATAEKASELGGKAMVPPFDAPWVRMTVIADPQGAMFIASKFVPENKDLGSPADAAAQTN
jgi:predicted enzyme related to lactoylglutathione lyase